MNLSEELKRINKLNILTNKTSLKIYCIDGDIVQGTYYGHTSALDNEPEEAQLDIISSKNNGIIGLLESEIESIEVVTE